MKLLFRWVLPAAIVGVGIALLAGWMTLKVPAQFGLRQLLGLVVILFGLLRLVTGWSGSRSSERRPYGGSWRKPWDND